MPESRNNRPMIKTPTLQNKTPVERMKTPIEKQQKNKSPSEKQQQQNKTPIEKQQQKNKTPNEKQQQGATPKSSPVTPVNVILLCGTALQSYDTLTA